MSIRDFVRTSVDPIRHRPIERLDLEKLYPRSVTDSTHVHLLPCRLDELEATSRGSRLGGLPLMAPGAKWPMGVDGPLQFIGQLDFDELWSLHKGALAMPPRGILTFFCDMKNQVEGGSSIHSGGWALSFANDVVPSADPRTRSFPTRPLDGELSMAPAHDLDEPLTLEPEHRVLWGRRVGGGRWVELALAIELASHDWDGTVATLRAVEARGFDVVTVMRRASEWRVLWQIDTDDEMGLHWLGNGRAFILIRKSDLVSGHFGKAICVIERA